ncbi:hypothetical protein HYH02_004250 [Chlamydomonas schloesseri]|uniref:Uncharacterized protein n=1 Tax=Chlamydomonas schloesseri TaxID=2026947 RepID=A0A835WPH9_9CHLO|nr:hypothetical protein HYH02_004250 [Chlamydomonas schloesseri]|eukprot:KAG2450978.1 hypothetical protein HYH02_004250 [Chlamydomonas schloesseri]
MGGGVLFGCSDRDALVRGGFISLQHLQKGGTPTALQQAGLPPFLVGFIDNAREHAKQAAAAAMPQQGSMANHGLSVAARPPARLPPASQSPAALLDTDAGHVRDQGSWWSSWLPAVPLLWSIQPSPPPQAGLEGPQWRAGPVVATAAAVAALDASPNAPAAERAADLLDACSATHTAASASATTPAFRQLTACRRRHVHGRVQGQE